jgi:serine/threonine protein kinase
MNTLCVAEMLSQVEGFVVVSMDMPDAAPGSMDAQEWARVRDILHGALEVRPGLRSAWLDEACGGDSGLRAEVESLLAAADRSAFLDRPATAPESGLLSGRRIAHYEVVEKIGEGGMGAVYKAIDTRLDRPVALKVLVRGVGTWSYERRFAREAKAASALNHPNIVTIYEFDSHEGLDYLSMEYVQGTTLHHLLEERALPLGTLLGYARQAAGAIARAHQAGIVHRDLKPGNIMVTHEGMVKVLDFGLAKRQPAEPERELTQTNLTMAGTVVGTPAYMSPEQANSEGEDWRTDIFSFGVILYEIVCGRRPFEGKNAHSIMYQITHAEPAAPSLVKPSTPPAVAALITKCLAKDRAGRPQSMDEVADVLASVTAEGPERGETGRSWQMPRRAWLAGGAIGAAVVFSGVWIWRPAPQSIAYSIEAQKMREGEPLGEPYPASSADTFEGGWRFRLRMRAGQPGYLYVINEGPGDSGKSRYWVLYPAAADGAALTANAETSTGWYVFDRNPGVEKLWIVWSDRVMERFEEILRGGTSGEVRDPAQAGSIQSILAGLQKPAEFIPAGQASRVEWRAAEGVIGAAIQLRHR